MHMQYACACLEIDMFLHRSALQFQLNSATIGGKTFEIIFGLFFADHCCCFSSKYAAIIHNTCAVCVVYCFIWFCPVSNYILGISWNALENDGKKSFCVFNSITSHICYQIKRAHHSSSDSIDQKMMIACLQQMAVCECVCRCIYKAHDTRLLSVQFSMLYRNLPYHPAIFQWKAANCLFHNNAAALVWSGVRVAER